MSETELKPNKAEDNLSEEKKNVLSDDEKIARLKELGLKSPGFLRDMLDKDLKDIDFAFLG